METNSRTIRDALNGRQNSFGALRVTFAVAVIVSHAWPLSGRGGDPTFARWNGQSHIGLLAVLGFLAISGYVVTKSAARLPLGRFAWHRFLRLYPAYWVTLIVSGFVIAPVVWALAGRDLSDFWGGPDGPLGYVLNNWTLWVTQWDVRSVFEPAPVGVSPAVGSMNGSLWSLAFELQCYAIIVALAGFGILRGAKVMVPVIAGLFGFLQIAVLMAPGGAIAVLPILSDKMVTLGWVFMLGASLAMYSDQIPMRHSYGIATTLIGLFTLEWGGFHLVGIPAFVYATVWVASAAPAWFHRVGAKNDYSYGIYLYGWPVQQMLAAAGLHHSFALYIVLSVLGATVLAWGSWHGVEKWAMRLKDVRVGRERAAHSRTDLDGVAPSLLPSASSNH